MPQNHLYTNPIPNNAIASHGLSWRHSVTKDNGSDQRSTGHDVRYKFTGKERDMETCFDYFGARYYASDLSIWLSVDPLADKYPSMSPYMYVGGPPTMEIDPDGMDWIKTKDGNYKYDKNITKDSKLGKGETYLGKSSRIKVNDSKGNHLYDIELSEDGSITDKMGINHVSGFGEYNPNFKSGHKIISSDLPSTNDFKNYEIINRNGTDYILYDNQWFPMMSVEEYEKYKKSRRNSRRPPFPRKLLATYSHMQGVVQQGGRESLIYGVGIGLLDIPRWISPISIMDSYVVGEYQAYNAVLQRMKQHDDAVDHLRKRTK